jgi:hypothetical protein
MITRQNILKSVTWYSFGLSAILTVGLTLLAIKENESGSAFFFLGADCYILASMSLLLSKWDYETKKAILSKMIRDEIEKKGMSRQLVEEARNHQEVK